MLGRQTVNRSSNKHSSVHSRGLNSSDGEEDDENGMESYKMWSFFRDKRRFAWSMLSILKNNMVSAPFYYVLAIIEYLEMLVLYMAFAFLFFKQGHD